MVEGVFPPPHVQSITIGQKRLAAQFLHCVRHRFGKVRTQKGKVSRLTEVDFDGGVFVFKIDVADPRLFDELLKFLQKVFAGFGPHIGKINF